MHVHSLDSAATNRSARRTSVAVPADLFPLPLTPFELFMLFADQPELPMMFCGELVFRGAIDRDILQQALNEAVARHPLLHARLDWSQKTPRWVSAESSSQPIVWLQESERWLADQVQPVDLTQQNGLRVFAEQGRDQSRLWLHFHHACCDGQGARPFIADLLTGYARGCSPELFPAAWDAWDYDSLKRRFQLDALLAGGEVVNTTVWQKLRDAYHFLVLTPRPLQSSLRSAGTVGPPILKFAFDSQQTDGLRRAVRKASATLNDVAIGLLFATLAEWNLARGSKLTERISVLMPTDLRSVKDSRMPAANRMSFSFIPRTLQQCCDQDSLLQGLRSETQRIKQTQIGRDFLSGIALLNAAPGLLRTVIQMPRCMATALLSNLGDPTKRFRRYFPSEDGYLVMGNLVLERIFATPPIRPRTHVGFGLSICANQLCISMLANEKVLGPEKQTLFDRYVERWHGWLP